MKRLFFLIALFGAVAMQAPKAWGETWRQVPQPEASLYPYGYEHGAAVYFKNAFWIIGCKPYILRSADGSSWHQVVLDAPFGTRFGHSLLVFDNKLWLFGGAGLNNPADYKLKNDVWCTSDGINWTRVVKYAAWSPRMDHAVIGFDGKMWLFGGSQASSRNVSIDTNSLNDIWYSSNGKDWTRAKSSASWSARSGHQVAYYDKRLWLIGGSNKNDVWRSENGKDWELWAANCPWLGRRGHSSPIINGRLWIIGGAQYTFDPNSGSTSSSYAITGDAWSSSDGDNWKKESAGSWSARYNFPCCGAGGTFWAFPGPGANSSYNAETWKTSTGASWTKAMWGFKSPLAQTNSAFAHNSKIWVFSESIANGAFPRAAWSGPDAIGWDLESQDATMSSPWEHQIPFSFDGLIWEVRNSFYLYNTPNAKAWTRVGSRLPIGDADSIIPHQNQLWLFDKVEYSSYPFQHDYLTNIWVSSDSGTTWTKKLGSSAKLLLSPVEVSFKGKMWSLDDKVRSSTDGSQWNLVLNSVPWGSATPLGAVAGNNRLWVVSAAKEVWSSADGAKWIKHCGPAPWTGASPFHIIACNEAIWYLSSRGNYYNYDTESSYGGEAWRFDTTNGVWSQAWRDYQ